MNEASWRILIAAVAALGGGGFATWLLRGAMREEFRAIVATKDGSLTEVMRTVFLPREEGVTRVDLEDRDEKRNEALGDILDKVERRIRDALHSEIGSLGNKLTRDVEHLQRELNVFGKGVDQALRQSTDADRRSLETKGSTDNLATRLDGIEKNLDTRLKHMESLLDILTRRSMSA